MEKEINLADKDTAIDFYDKRYHDGYMEEWDTAKKKQVKEILQLLNLPPNGRALDFGCGNGVFTNIIKEALPEWEVFGVEISPKAIENARNRFPHCHFFGLDEVDKYEHFFDLLFSHHVIEHVQNLTETFQVINTYLKSHAYQLHILPCGNKGSFEYDICKLKKNGIEKDRDNRFFFEEPGHLRRLDTIAFTTHEQSIGFSLKNEFYANQYYGAINWITKSSPRFVKRLTNPSDAINFEAINKLATLRKRLLFLTLLQFPYSKYLGIKNKWHKKASDYSKVIFLFIPAMISKPIYMWMERKAIAEWTNLKHDAKGSEMFLFFER